MFLVSSMIVKGVACLVLLISWFGVISGYLSAQFFTRVLAVLVFVLLTTEPVLLFIFDSIRKAKGGI